VDEYRTAASGDPGPRIVVDLDNQIVESIGAPEPITWFIGRAPESAIVAPVGRIFTPSVGGADAAHG
jgi:hypothetical protein